jgi:hypothetical protein
MAENHFQKVTSLLLALSLSACGGSGSLAGTGSSTPSAGLVPLAKAPASSRISPLSSPIAASIKIDAGGAAATGTWLADTDYAATGWGSTAAVTSAITTSHVTEPAPQAVYQTQRWAPHLTYTIPNLTPGGAYTVRLDFVESFFNAAQQRVFNVGINGVRVLSGFDIFKAAGGRNIAVAQGSAATADGQGVIAIALDATVNNASIAGIEISVAAGAPSPPPTAPPSPPPTAAPSPSPAASPTPPATSGVGPRVPVGPQVSNVCPSGAVQIAAGTNVQSVVSAHRAGTAYCFAAGTYAQLQITPQSGDTYVGLKGAVLDGQHAAAHAFSGWFTGVTIENFLIKNYNDAYQDAPIVTGPNWTIRNNEIANNAAAGVDVTTGANVVANFIHNNGQKGYTILGSNVVFSDNEIAANNPSDAYNPNSATGDTGGGKAWQTTNLLMQYNFVHDNHGPGLWSDTDNQGTVYRYNDIENNWAGGIFHEASWDAVIANNVVKNNANTKYCTYALWCSDIQIASSGGVNGKIVDVYDNTVVSNGSQGGNAIGLISENRGANGTSGLYGTWLVQNVHVHNNSINLAAGGLTGAETDNGATGIFTSQGNWFNNNTYTGAGKSFFWNGTTGSFAFFQGQGQEMNGTSL